MNNQYIEVYKMKGARCMSNWYLQNGKESDVVLSTIIRLARNIKEFEFPKKFSK